MDTYLAIITTVLVLTQIIRLIQNYIQLKNLKKHYNRMDVKFNKKLDEIMNEHETKMNDFDKIIRGGQWIK